MAGTPIAGFDGELKIGSTVIGYIDTWSLSITQGTAEVSQIGTRAKAFIPTSTEWSGSLSGTFAYGDTEQKALVDALVGTTVTAPLDAVFLKAGAEGHFTGKIIPSGASINAAHGDKISISFNFQGTGALTVASAAS